MLYGREAQLPDCSVQPVEELSSNAAARVRSSLCIEGLLKKLLQIKVRVPAAQAHEGYTIQ
jgi:hypothetical protein